ncbi:hypothetical protein [Paenirhodobacter enshiensis]|uniref:hypothetical protein n=1 Tax=Paenirhodobacter enshiensis TaxID=1105367 RepID=UPI003FA22DDA
MTDGPILSGPTPVQHDDGFGPLRELERSLTTVRAGLADIALIASPIAATQARDVIGAIDAFRVTVTLFGSESVGKPGVLAAIAGQSLPEGGTIRALRPVSDNGEPAVPALLTLRQTPDIDAVLTQPQLCLVVLGSGSVPSVPEAALIRKVYARHPAETICFVNSPAGSTAETAALVGWLAVEGLDDVPVFAGQAATGDGIVALRAAISAHFAAAEGRMLRETVLARTRRIMTLMEGQQAAAPSAQPPLRLLPDDLGARIAAIRSEAGEACDKALERLKLELDLRMDRRQGGFQNLCTRRLTSWVETRGADADWACSTTELRLHLRATYLWYSTEVIRALRQIAAETAARTTEIYAARFGVDDATLPVPDFAPPRIALPCGLDEPLINIAPAPARRSIIPFRRADTGAGTLEHRLNEMTAALGRLIAGIRGSVEPTFETESREALMKFTGECCRLLTEQSMRPTVVGLRA